MSVILMVLAILSLAFAGLEAMGVSKAIVQQGVVAQCVICGMTLFGLFLTGGAICSELAAIRKQLKRDADKRAEAEVLAASRLVKRERIKEAPERMREAPERMFIKAPTVKVMAHVVQCPNCDAPIDAADLQDGDNTCPSCGEVFEAHV